MEIFLASNHWCRLVVEFWDSLYDESDINISLVKMDKMEIVPYNYRPLNTY